MMKIARNPIVLTIVAVALIFVIASLAGQRMSRPSYQTGTVEKVSAVRRIYAAPAVGSENGVPQGLGAAVRQPKLEVHSPNIATSSSVPQAVKPSNNIAQPQIARTGKVSLFVTNIERAVSAVTRVARAQGGDVFSSNVDNGNGNEVAPSSAEMEIRVPSDRFDAAMSGVASFGKVREHSTSAEDLSADITDSDARLRNLRRTESDMLKIMDRSGSIAQVMDAENQLSQVREQIETLESELKAMRGRVSYATISVSMQAEVAAPPAERTPVAQLVSAWNDAVHSLGLTLVGIAGFVLWVVVYLPLIAAFAAAVYGLRSVVVRRLQRSRSIA